MSVMNNKSGNKVKKKTLRVINIFTKVTAFKEFFSAI